MKEKVVTKGRRQKKREDNSMMMKVVSFVIDIFIGNAIQTGLLFPTRMSKIQCREQNEKFVVSVKLWWSISHDSVH